MAENSLFGGGGIAAAAGVSGEIYSVDAVAAFLSATVLAAIFTALVDKIAARRGTNYYYGIVVVIIVIAVAALAMYSDACGACGYACREVKECGIVWKNILEVQIKCVCK